MAVDQPLARTMPVELAREIARQGEARLDAIMDLSTAAVARATTLCGIFGAAGVTITAAVLAYLSSTQPARTLICGGSVTAFLLLVAAGLAAFAGAPRDFRIKGSSPAELTSWAARDSGWRTEVELLKAIGDRLAQAIETDRLLLEREAELIKWSLRFGALAVLLGPLVTRLV